jgi:hypothetical protein
MPVRKGERYTGQNHRAEILGAQRQIPLRGRAAQNRRLAWLPYRRAIGDPITQRSAIRGQGPLDGPRQANKFRIEKGFMRGDDHIAVPTAIHEVEIWRDLGIRCRGDRGRIQAALHRKAGVHSASRGEVDGGAAWLAGL